MQLSNVGLTGFAVNATALAPQTVVETATPLASAVNVGSAISSIVQLFSDGDVPLGTPVKVATTLILSYNVVTGIELMS